MEQYLRTAKNNLKSQLNLLPEKVCTFHLKSHDVLQLPLFLSPIEP